MACAYLAQGFITTQGKTHCPVQWEVPLLTQTSHKPYSPRFHHSQSQYMNIFLKDTFKMYPTGVQSALMLPLALGYHSCVPPMPFYLVIGSSTAEFLCYSRPFLIFSSTHLRYLCPHPSSSQGIQK